MKAAELEAGRAAVDYFPLLSSTLAQAAGLPTSLSQALLCLWRVDAGIDVAEAVYNVTNAHPVASDGRLLCSFIRRLLATGKLDCARNLFVQLAHSPHISCSFGAVALAAAIPSIDSWSCVWHDARRICDTIAAVNPVEAQLTRAAVARQLVVWAISAGELGAVLESSMNAIEESAILEILVCQWENELEAGLMLHVFHDILLAWYIHRDRHEEAKLVIQVRLPSVRHVVCMCVPFI